MDANQHLIENVIPFLTANPGFISCLESRRSEVQLHYVRGDNRQLSFSWEQDLMIDGWNIPLGNYPRYDNDFAQVAWGEKTFNIRSQNHFIDINFDTGYLNYD